MPPAFMKAITTPPPARLSGWVHLDGFVPCAGTLPAGSLGVDSNDPGIGRDCHVLLARDQYAQKNLRMTSENR
jgi:hypothetical protein